MRPNRARFPAFSREEIGYRNAIAQAPAALGVALGGGEWRLAIAPAVAGALPDPPVRLKADWGGAPFELAVDDEVAARFLRHAVPGADAAALPEPLRLAALETLRAEAESALGTTRPLRLDAIGGASASQAARHRFAFQFSSTVTGEAIAGQVATDVLGLSYAAPLLRAAKAAAGASDAAWLEDLAVPVRLEAGWSAVDADELADLAEGDLILLDESWLASGELTVAVASRLAFRGRVEAQTFTVTQPLGALMAEPADSAPSDRIPVRLTFDLGERTLTLAQLRDLKPGFTFDLGRDLRRAVAIRANGQPVGEGELVEIDGTLGVCVTSLGVHDKPA
jgi:type III secretion protein Q